MFNGDGICNLAFVKYMQKRNCRELFIWLVFYNVNTNTNICFLNVPIVFKRINEIARVIARNDKPLIRFTKGDLDGNNPDFKTFSFMKNWVSQILLVQNISAAKVYL